jgi:hypothetical protein
MTYRQETREFSLQGRPPLLRRVDAGLATWLPVGRDFHFVAEKSRQNARSRRLAAANSARLGLKFTASLA